MLEKALMDVYLAEFDKLKAEQIQRIGFRDNMIYVTLVSVGAVVSFATGESSRLYALLIIPWICCVLGWMYLVNDEKISAIGRYIRLELDVRIRGQIGSSDQTVVLGWEVSHRSDRRRIQRKIVQLLVDELTFCVSGVTAVCAFWLLSPSTTRRTIVLGGVELVFLLVLGYLILRYADLKRGI